MTSTAGQEQSGTIPPGETPDGAPAAPGEPGSSSLHGGARHQIADRVFRSLAVGSGFLITLVIALIAIFLLAQAIPSLAKNTANFFTYTGPWVTSGTELTFGIPQLFYATVVVSVIALLLAMPIALGITIFLTEYAPKRLVGPITYTVDLLAAVPSIVYGLWGILVLGPALVPVNEWLVGNLGFLPFFQQPTQVANMSTGGTLLTASIVLAVMILPIITAVTREVFMQTPKGHREAALALGATKFEVVKLAVMPFGFSGYISGAMLGLGRALGETMALLLIISTVGPMNFNLMESGETFATKIANNAAEFDSPAKTGAYISAGLTLFVLTFIVNAAARAVVGRKK
ncbi:phosphate ABC transporter, inner membrane subunit PstC [Gordonia bronchialis DSM 43247]|uniref:Phosphate transport system permease protein n=1 Tax=Gordonia bronchialis (strain ATCC 25592 / DSM 43247 / BCRC 13721 / JCM 3198 / KCTC 3076 / NBRC 16047 / NCTC 10667) TaxID=526226 RepID=D0L3U8_GORB4|nr:phosphate ABC transporter permease subunit PstC [Gordonia bronchialis]ACY23101.1 phosphate ABC transporter, inner membrane subunit PstC [Gordonia bronchialis DSM 43247]MCC3325880.1 phosphate ABC transporter permease subunit PstC [Gordonia bronchialis]QGS23485.1 phosphate ABC transporter permease subunit PstC [Gordonia bronchialis]UAK40320.1 phosphate ABC transporter permease subunit PstC [Gordonia bronchialis]STQ66056.1 Phosphate transport system permease protein pstC [Gordonia bronchialis]